MSEVQCPTKNIWKTITPRTYNPYSKEVHEYLKVFAPLLIIKFDKGN